MYYSYVTIVFPIITLACLAFFFCYYKLATRPLAGTTEWITWIIDKPRFSMTFKRHPMERRDALPVIVITLVCVLLGFFKLGDMQAPESFYRFESAQKTIVITLDEAVDIGTLMYYPGLWIGHYDLSFSSDGANWHQQYPGEDDDKEFAMDQPHSNLFKWLYADLNKDNLPTKYIRLTASTTPLELGEIALYDDNGDKIPSDQISSEAPELFDEQNVVPDAPSYMNSMYFDEIYHGRTAYENLEGVRLYETTHPPLGKLIISIGISLFGMVPFGWRFMGVVFGAAMLPILYIFLKNMFGKTPIAVCGTILFGFDFMHFVQTRIATIDTYGVFFILLAYFFMYRYVTGDPEKPFRKTLAPLALSGLFFGIGCASKWIVIYAGAGLLALYVIHLVWCYKVYARNELPGFGRLLAKTLAFSVLFFLVVPAVVYCLSYIQNGRIAGMSLKDGMLWDPAYYRLIWDSQKLMYNYHSGLVATHSYSSTWWMWILDARPILYFRDTSMGGGLKSSFAAFGNPIVWWGGFMAMIAMGYQFIKFKDGKALFILIGYLSQLGPWLIISRVVFIYHYFPSVLFLVLALAHMFNTIWERKYRHYKRAVYTYTAATVGLFAAFYPVLSGIPVSEVYTKYFLRWIPPAWPF